MASSLSPEAMKIRKFESRKASEVLRMLNGATPLLQFRHMVKVLEQQGFDIQPYRDNKSVRDDVQLYDSLAQYNQVKKWEVSWEAFEYARELTFAAFARKGKRLNPLDLQEAQLHIKLNKSSGAPLFRKKGEVLGAEVSRAGRILNGDKKPPPCVAFHRIQHGPAGPKTRLVWGYPASMTLLEGRFAAPLISQFLRSQTPMVLGLTKLTLSARLRHLRNARHQFGLDFSRFDASICTKLIGLAFDVIRTWFDEEYHGEIHQLENYFIFTPIVMPDGYIYMKQRGVPSGSYFTQLVDSFVNYFAIQYAALRARESCLTRILVLGDDSVFAVENPVNLQQFAKYLGELGLTMNPLKSSSGFNGKNVHFLGHDWSCGLPDRPLHETAIRMCLPERYTKSSLSGEALERQRFAAYLGDSLSAYQIVRKLDYMRLPSLLQMAKQALCLEPVSGWQLYMEDRKSVV